MIFDKLLCPFAKIYKYNINLNVGDRRSVRLINIQQVSQPKYLLLAFILSITSCDNCVSPKSKSENVSHSINKPEEDINDRWQPPATVAIAIISLMPRETILNNVCIEMHHNYNPVLVVIALLPFAVHPVRCFAVLSAHALLSSHIIIRCHLCWQHACVSGPTRYSASFHVVNFYSAGGTGMRSPQLSARAN